MSDTNNVRPVESSGRTNKRDLISQLAEQLARAKEKSSLLQDAIDDAEKKLEIKYKERDQEEAKYEGERDKNEMTVRALRREIQRANGELEAAAVIDEAEAAFYLELLQDPRPSPPRHAPPTLDDVRSGQYFVTAPTSESLVDPPIAKNPPSPKTIAPLAHSSKEMVATRKERAISGLSDKPFGLGEPQLSGTAANRTAQRMAHIQAVLDNTPAVVAPAPRAPLVEAFKPLALTETQASEDFPPRPKTKAELAADERLRELNAEADRAWWSTTPSSSSSTNSGASESIVYPPTVLSTKAFQASVSLPYYSFPDLHTALASRTSFSTCRTDSPTSTGRSTSATSHDPNSHFREPNSRSEALAAIFAMPKPVSRSHSLDQMRVSPSADEFGVSGPHSRTRSTTQETATYDRNHAIGPKEGAKLLASKHARDAQTHAEQLPDNVSIGREFHEKDFSDGSLEDSQTPMRRAPAPLSPAPPKTSTGGDSVTPRMTTAPEGSLKELTRRASVEDDLIKANGEGKAARARRDSVSRGIAAGLATPFGGAGIVGRKERDPEASRHPPTAGGASSRQRTRSDASTTSTGSTNKDFMLSQLAEALKKERRRCEMYQNELLAIEEEMDEVESAMSASKERYEDIISSQKETIANLRAELAELARELETAHDLDAKDAEQYLALLGTSTPRTESLIDTGKRQEGRFHESGLVDEPKAKSKTARRLDTRLEVSDLDSPAPAPEKRSMYRKLSKRRPAPPATADEVEPPHKSRVAKESPAAPSPIKGPIRRVAPPPAPIDLGDGGIIKPKTSISRPPMTGLNNGAAENVRPRKNSLTEKFAGTLRNLFPALGPPQTLASFPPPSSDDEVPRGDHILSWLKTSDLHGIRGGETGVGYSNPFLKT